MNAKFEKLLPPTRIQSANVKVQEMLLGYLLAPFCAMIANAIFASYLNRYYVDVLGWTKFGVFATILPIVSSFIVILGNLLVGQWIDNTRTAAGKARPYLLISIPCCGNSPDVHDARRRGKRCANALDCRNL